ncbi:hypothetical protein Naga_103273g1 [Nannochloropsis gaditana]|uniref:Uncharacterized protein n=1 Tax=Nannochloropsis gaditana TaxID=72520 RepID=W7TFY8_9STRA|nr:hypothetical protein Naga_103273g1 [Nannochloropsis gaditana]
MCAPYGKAFKKVNSTFKILNHTIFTRLSPTGTSGGGKGRASLRGIRQIRRAAKGIRTLARHLQVRFGQLTPGEDPRTLPTVCRV